MKDAPIVSIVLGTYNRLTFLRHAIASVRRECAPLPCEIIVVDGGSTDGTLRWLPKQKDIISIVQHNHGNWRGVKVERRSWGYFMNLGFKAASGKYVCMLSDDCLVIPGAIGNGLRFFDDRIAHGAPIGALAFYWRNWPEEKRYRVGVTLGGKMFVNHGMYLKEALEEVGYIDEESYSFYHADGDLCLKMWHAGYTCEASPESYIEHYSHANRSVRVRNLSGQEADWRAYLSKWGGVFYDPSKREEGSWIEKSYVDCHKTVRRIRALHVLVTLKRTVGVLFDYRGMGRRARKLLGLVRHE